MPAVCLIGAQWGDEGKGKLVDVFSREADITVRYQGGANAGHSIKAEGKSLVLHLIPSGILQEKTQCFISSGVVLDLESLLEEVGKLKELGFLKSDKQLKISSLASLVLPFHKDLDLAREEAAGKNKIGTTGRGVGPAYESRMSRSALVFSDLFETEEVLLQKIKKSLKEPSFLLTKLYNKKEPRAEDIFLKLKKIRPLLKPYLLSSMSETINQALEEGKKVLFEGAQGSLLDVFHGSYPYVTSSSTITGGALGGAGLGFSHFTKSWAIMKAYTTRVGEGPFPTEIKEEDAGVHLAKKGQEFGATTGRKRRCGWLDLPALKYATHLNGSTSLALMKLDVLTGLKEIKVCVSYEEEKKPVYKSFPSWSEDLSKIKSKKDLPKKALNYLEFIEKSLNLPIDVISVGPDRSQTLILKPLF